MARSTKASKRAGPHSEVSGGAQQTTTSNTEPSSSTAPKEPKGRADHEVSPDTNASSQTAQKTKSRKRSAQAPKDVGAPSKKQRKMLRQPKLPKNEPLANSSATLYTSPQRVGILCLPIELHQHVLSYASARDAARYRRVCKSTNRLVVNSQKFLLRAYAGGALSRLEEAVDEFNGLKIPHDTDSLVEALHVWTKRRGQFACPVSSWGSIMKLMAHLFLNKYPVDQNNEREYVTIIDWASIARDFTTMSSTPPKDWAHWGWTRANKFSELAGINLLDDNELNKLFDYAENPQSQTASHRLDGQLWSEWKPECMTLPIRSWRLTPILKHPTTLHLEAPEARNRDWPFDEGSIEQWCAYLDDPDDHDVCGLPGLENDRLVRYLGLPALPDTVSCYYVSDRWAREQIKMLVGRLDHANRRQKKKVMVAPLLRAAILEHVRYF